MNNNNDFQAFATNNNDFSTLIENTETQHDLFLEQQKINLFEYRGYNQFVNSFKSEQHV